MTDNSRRKIIDILLISLLIFLGIIIMKKAFFIIFPILIGSLFADMMKSSMKKISPISNAAKKVLVVIMLLIFFALISLIMILLFDRILRFVSLIGNFLGDNLISIENSFSGLIDFAEEKIEKFFHRDMHSEISEYMVNLLSKFLDSFIDFIPAVIKNIAAFFPKAFISLIIFIFSAYYFSFDSDIFKGKINYKNKYGKSIVSSLKKTIGAYSILFAITFALLLTGLLMLKINNPVSLALMTAFVDLLPIFGVGTVLLPWAIIMMMTGKTGLGIGILILWIIIFITRQLLEPKIVGTKLDIHPIITLISVIVGLYFFGFTGLIFVPLTVSVILQSIKKAPSNDGA